MDVGKVWILVQKDLNAQPVRSSRVTEGNKQETQTQDTAPSVLVKLQECHCPETLPQDRTQTQREWHLWEVSPDADGLVHPDEWGEVSDRRLLHVIP